MITHYHRGWAVWTGANVQTAQSGEAGSRTRRVQARRLADLQRLIDGLEAHPEHRGHPTVDPDIDPRAYIGRADYYRNRADFNFNTERTWLRNNAPCVDVFSYVSDDGGYWIRWDSDARRGVPFWLDIASRICGPSTVWHAEGYRYAESLAGSQDPAAFGRRWLTRPSTNHKGD